MAYLDRTKQGLRIEALYMYKSYENGTLLALIKRDEDWMWAWAYNPETGTWGQGHYMFGSKTEALADLKKRYRNAIPVRRSSIVQITTDGDSFGWYENIEIAQKRAYYLVKNRHHSETFYIFNPSKNYFWYVWKTNGMIVCSNSKTNTTHRLFANGSI